MQEEEARKADEASKKEAARKEAEEEEARKAEEEEEAAGLPPGKIEQLAVLVQAGGAVLVVCVALGTVAAVGLGMIDNVPSDQRATVITAAFGVIGTVVGAYTGAKLGGRSETDRDHLDMATKVGDMRGRRRGRK
jgi:uncharacterized membrane protein YdbT with pleckstrin-like domain